MSSFPILDLVVGVIFVYFLLSIICSAAVEMILTIRKLRAKMLEEWLCKIFSNEITVGNTSVKLGQAIMDHCSVTALSGTGKSTSYIDAKNFTAALLEKITYDPDEPLHVATNINTIINILQRTDVLSIELQRTFLSYAFDARDEFNKLTVGTATDLQLFRKKIEDWFDSSMDRVGGTLKSKYTRYWTFTVALIATVLLNADSISISKYLYNNPQARMQLADQAYKEVEDSALLKTFAKMQAERPGDTASLAEITANISKKIKEIELTKATLESTIPLGWNKTVFKDGEEVSCWLILSKIVGLAATILAIMMGAPFWFDVLNKVSNLRGTGNKPKEVTTASSAGTVPAPVSLTIQTKTEGEAAG